jgi:hypothetical protein
MDSNSRDSSAENFSCRADHQAVHKLVRKVLDSNPPRVDIALGAPFSYGVLILADNL